MTSVVPFVSKIFKRWDMHLCYWHSCIFHVLPETQLSGPCSGKYSSHTLQHLSVFISSNTYSSISLWEPVCTGIFLSYFSLLLPYILSVFISTHPFKIPCPVWNYHTLSSEVLREREAPLLSMLMKMKWKKIPSAIYIAPSLFAKNQMVSFQARSKAEI